MQNRTLGKSGIAISSIGLGTNYVGGHNLYAEVDESQAVRLVQRAIDLGITFIDTADVYGTGRSEERGGVVNTTLTSLANEYGPKMRADPRPQPWVHE